MTEPFINNFQDHSSIISVNTETTDNDDDNKNKNKSDEYNAFLPVEIKGLYSDLLLCIVLQPSGSSTIQQPRVKPYNPWVEPYNFSVFESHNPSVLNHTNPQCWTIWPLGVEPHNPSVLNHTYNPSVEPYNPSVFTQTSKNKICISCWNQHPMSPHCDTAMGISYLMLSHSFQSTLKTPFIVACNFPFRLSLLSLCVHMHVLNSLCFL